RKSSSAITTARTIRNLDESTLRKWPINIPPANEAAQTRSGARAKCIRGSSAIVFGSTAEMNYRFDMMSLREHIKCENRVKRISACNYLAKIAGQRGRIARDVADAFRLQFKNAGDNARLSACARRVEQHKIKRSKPRVMFVPRQPVPHIGFLHLGITQ